MEKLTYTEEEFQAEIEKLKEQIEKRWQEAEKSVMSPQYITGKLSAYSDVLEYLEKVMNKKMAYAFIEEMKKRVDALEEN